MGGHTGARARNLTPCLALVVGLGFAGVASADEYIGDMAVSACKARGGYAGSTISSANDVDPNVPCYLKSQSWAPTPMVSPPPRPRTVMVPRATVTHTYRTVTVAPRIVGPTSSQVLQQNLGTLSNAIGILGAFEAERQAQREAAQAQQEAEDAAREEQRRQQEEAAAEAAKAADDAGRDAMPNAFDQAANGSTNAAPASNPFDVADTSNPMTAMRFGDSQAPTPRVDLAANAKTPEQTELLEPGGSPAPIQPMGLDSPENRADIDAMTAAEKAALYPPSPAGTDTGGAQSTQEVTAQPVASESGPAKPEIYGPPAPGEATPGALAQAGAAKPEIYGPPAPSETTQATVAQASSQTIAERPVEVRNGPELQFEQARAASGSTSVVTPPPVQTPPGPVEVASNTITAPTVAATISTQSATTANTATPPPPAQPEIYGPPLPPQSPATGSETPAPSVPTSPQDQLVVDVLKNNPGLGSSASATAISNIGGRPSDPLPTILVATTQTNEAAPRSPPAQVKVRPDTPPPPTSLRLPPEKGLSKRPLYTLGPLASNLTPAQRAACISWAKGYEEDLTNAANIVSAGTPTDQTSIGSSDTIQHDSYIINANELAVVFNSRCTGL